MSHDEIANRIIQDVDAFGWHVVLIPEDDEGPSFAYTIGLLQTLKHPEIIMFGFDLDMMHDILNNLGEAIRQGARFDTDAYVDDILEGYPVTFRPIDARHYDDFVSWAQWFHERDADRKNASSDQVPFAVWQCYWPAKNGKFPWDWDESCPPDVRAKQPILSE